MKMTETLGTNNNEEKDQHFEPERAELLDFSQDINEYISEGIESYMKRGYVPNEKLVQPEIKVALFLKDVTERIISGESPQALDFEKVFENFILAYTTDQSVYTGYLWFLMTQLVEPRVLEFISEEIAEAESRSEPVKYKKILSKLSQIDN